MRVIRVYPESRFDWDPHIVGNDEAGIQQSFYWARVSMRVYGAEPIFLHVTDGSGAIAGSLLVTRVPILSRFPSWCWRVAGGVTRTVGCMWAIEWTNGPVLKDEDTSWTATLLLLDWLDDCARSLGAGALRWHGWVLHSRFAHSELLSEVLLRRGFTRSEWATSVIDLSVPDDVLWSSITHAARKCVIKSHKEGIVVEEVVGLDGVMKEFYEPYVRSESLQGRVPPSAQAMRASLEEDTERTYRYFVAKRSSTVLAVLAMHMFNGTATEVMSSLCPEARAAHLPAQDALHWELIRYARANGCRRFDLGGFNPLPRTGKEAGIRRFKEKWGGETRRYFQYARYSRGLSGLRAGVGLLRALLSRAAQGGHVGGEDT